MYCAKGWNEAVCIVAAVGDPRSNCFLPSPSFESNAYTPTFSLCGCVLFYHWVCACVSYIHCSFYNTHTDIPTELQLQKSCVITMGFQFYKVLSWCVFISMFLVRTRSHDELSKGCLIFCLLEKLSSFKQQVFVLSYNGSWYVIQKNCSSLFDAIGVDRDWFDTLTYIVNINLVIQSC